MNRKIFSLLLFSLFSLSVSADNAAPFGLTWGMSQKDVENLGVTLTAADSGDDWYEHYYTEDLPIGISIAERYSLTFANGYGLQKLGMKSEKISNDVRGIKGRDIYKEIKTSLIEKYGSPSSEFEYTGRKKWKDTDKFYLCIMDVECGYWISFFDETEESGQYIGLSLVGLGRDEGYISLHYNGPQWRNSRNAQEAEKAAHYSNAL